MANIEELVDSLGKLNLTTPAGKRSAREQLQALYASTPHNPITCKAPCPQVFTGGRDALATRDWLEAMECCCKRSNVPPGWTEAAVDYLPGTARTWFRLSGLETSANWDTFKTGFTKEFKPSDHKQAIIRELRKLRQASLKTNDAYINRLRDLALQLDDPSDTMLREYFIHGLITDTQLQVQLANPPTWQEAIGVAERINAVIFSVRHKTKTDFMPTHNQGAGNKDQSDLPPGEPMDVDSLSACLASMINTFKRSSTPYITRNPLPKLTPTERAHLRRIGACYRRRTLGHIADKCREFGQNLHAESGNDQGEA
ncbi:hypothetical protein BGZ68_002545 [Mortierella alpina]|nr:hypothetical protein BGZ68_002545 [Mortierella alpina]